MTKVTQCPLALLLLIALLIMPLQTFGKTDPTQYPDYDWGSADASSEVDHDLAAFDRSYLNYVTGPDGEKRGYVKAHSAGLWGEYTRGIHRGLKQRQMAFACLVSNHGSIAAISYYLKTNRQLFPNDRKGTLANTLNIAGASFIRVDRAHAILSVLFFSVYCVLVTAWATAIKLWRWPWLAIAITIMPAAAALLLSLITLCFGPQYLRRLYTWLAQRLSGQPNEQDREFFEKALAEFESGNIDKGFWATALAKSEGDKNKAKSFYIKYRALEWKQAAKHCRT